MAGKSPLLASSAEAAPLKALLLDPAAPASYGLIPGRYSPGPHRWTLT